MTLIINSSIINCLIINDGIVVTNSLNHHVSAEGLFKDPTELAALQSYLSSEGKDAESEVVSKIFKDLHFENNKVEFSKLGGHLPKFKAIFDDPGKTAQFTQNILRQGKIELFSALTGIPLLQPVQAQPQPAAPPLPIPAAAAPVEQQVERLPGVAAILSVLNPEPTPASVEHRKRSAPVQEQELPKPTEQKQVHRIVIDNSSKAKKPRAPPSSLLFEFRASEQNSSNDNPAAEAEPSGSDFRSPEPEELAREPRSLPASHSTDHVGLNVAQAGEYESWIVNQFAARFRGQFLPFFLQNGEEELYRYFKGDTQVSEDQPLHENVQEELKRIFNNSEQTWGLISLLKKYHPADAEVLEKRFTRNIEGQIYFIPLTNQPLPSTVVQLPPAEDPVVESSVGEGATTRASLEDLKYIKRIGRNFIQSYLGQLIIYLHSKNENYIAERLSEFQKNKTQVKCRVDIQNSLKNILSNGVLTKKLIHELKIRGHEEISEILHARFFPDDEGFVETYDNDPSSDEAEKILKANQEKKKKFGKMDDYISRFVANFENGYNDQLVIFFRTTGDFELSDTLKSLYKVSEGVRPNRNNQIKFAGVFADEEFTDFLIQQLKPLKKFEKIADALLKRFFEMKDGKLVFKPAVVNPAMATVVAHEKPTKRAQAQESSRIRKTAYMRRIVNNFNTVYLNQIIIFFRNRFEKNVADALWMNGPVDLNETHVQRIIQSNLAKIFSNEDFTKELLQGLNEKKEFEPLADILRNRLFEKDFDDNMVFKGIPLEKSMMKESTEQAEVNIDDQIEEVPAEPVYVPAAAQGVMEPSVVEEKEPAQMDDSDFTTMLPNTLTDADMHEFAQQFSPNTPHLPPQTPQG